MRRKVLAALALCLALGMLFAGCGERSGESDAERPDGSSSVPGAVSGESSAEPETDDWVAYDGTYRLHNENPVLRAMSLTLNGRAWELQAPGEVLSGSFTVNGGRIGLLYAVSPEDSFGRDLLASGSAAEGDSVELFSGVYAPGTVYLEPGAGVAASDFEYIFFLDGELPDVSGSAWSDPACDGSYFSAEEEAVIRLAGGVWTGEMYGEPVSGTYGIFCGRIFLFYTVRGSDPFGRDMIEYEQAQEGDVIYLYGGTVGDGVLTLESVMGALYGEPAVYRRDGSEA